MYEYDTDPKSCIVQYTINSLMFMFFVCTVQPGTCTLYSLQYRIPRYSVPRGILYPLPKIHVHLLVSSLEVLHSFPCTEQMCSPEKAGGSGISAFF